MSKFSAPQPGRLSSHFGSFSIALANQSAQTDGDLTFALDLPAQWKTSREILLIKGWCFSRSGKQIVGVRAKIGSKGRLARYGLERPDLVRSFRDFPLARHSGFQTKLRALRFLRPPSKRSNKDRTGSRFSNDEVEDDQKGGRSPMRNGTTTRLTRENEAREQIPRFSPLSADKGFLTV